MLSVHGTYIALEPSLDGKEPTAFKAVVLSYFRVGNARRAFGWIRFEMMRKIRRFAMKQKGRRGCGWKRWSNEAIYKEWGLVNDYRVQYFYRSPVKVSPAR
jgi:hypothetical protein